MRYADFEKLIHSMTASASASARQAFALDTIGRLHASAVDSWADYRLTSHPVYIAHIAINMVNAVDYDIGGDTAEYSVDNMLGAPEMVAEYNRQRRMLVATE